MTIQTLTGPQADGDQPELQISLNLGFFSGVSLQTTTKSYDWKTGELNARFAVGASPGPELQSARNAQQPSSSGGIELQAILLDGKISAARLVGALTGVTELVLEASEESPNLTPLDSVSLSLSRQDNPEDNFASLSLKALSNQTKKPEHSDLPSFPSLEASFTFPGVSHTESTAEVFYDPLIGEIEIRTGSFSKLVFRNLFTAPEDLRLGLETLKRGPDNWQGSIFTSAKKLVDVVARIDGLSLTEQTQTKVWMYDGVYQAVQGSTDPLKTRVRFESTGEQGVNPGEPVFSKFPALKMSMLLCSGGRSLQQRTADAFEVDFINKSARLRSHLGPDAILYKVDFDYNWQKLTGTATRIGGGVGGPTSMAEFNLVRIEENSPFDCAALEAD
jgi:hypothetical protein